tara:strand:+ start:2564 stop:3934 length:1371 start_codon:yes stop_codon:yes gene_type:complete
MLKNIQINNLFEYLKKLLIPKKEQKVIIYVLSLFYLINLLFVIVFGRPFVGILIFNQQLGKAYVLGGAISLLIILFISIFLNKKIPKEIRILTNSSILILIGFAISLFLNDFQLNMYLFKSSSYIWSLGYIGFGYYFLSKINKELIVLAVFLSAFSLYFISVINYPNFIIDIFISNSDKFQLVKAADSLLIFVILNLIVDKYSNISENLKLSILMFSFGLFLPYYIYQSRGSLLAALLFFTICVFSYRKFILNNYLIVFIYTFVTALLFYLSSYSIAFISVDEEFMPENFAEANTGIIDNILTEKEPRSGFLTFYFDNGRIKSLDATTDWRLDIWQDLLDDLSLNDKLFAGFGYSEPFGIMSDPSEPGRLGRDGLNEHVHNYFFNIIGRGGLLQLAFFLIFYLCVYIVWKRKNLKSIDFVKLFLPIMIVSSLDVTMEGVHFPFIFLSFLGYFLSSD